MPARYTERLLPPWWWWILVVIFVLTVGLVVLAVGPIAALVAMAVAAAGTVAGLLAWSARIEVTERELVAGRAHIPLGLLGQPVALEARRARHARGPGFSPAAFHLLRGWVSTAVVVQVHDPADPTPYWYVSTRRPDQLAAAIVAAQARHPG